MEYIENNDLHYKETIKSIQLINTIIKVNWELQKNGG